MPKMPQISHLYTPPPTPQSLNPATPADHAFSSTPSSWSHTSSCLISNRPLIPDSQPHLLARLERRQAYVRAAVTAEGVSERAVAAAADLALHGEVYFRQIGGLQFSEALVGFRPLGRVLGGDLLGEAARAVFARSAALTGCGTAFWCWKSRGG